MIHSITVTNYLGESITLDLTRPEDSGFIVTSITGLGAGDASINVTEVSTNDGGKYNSARLSSRNIVINLRFYQTGTLSIEDIRQLSYKYFPIKKKLTLLIETDNRECQIEGYVESNEPDIFSDEEDTDISIICPDPFFYSSEVTETDFYGIEPNFEFPFCNDSLEEDLLEMSTIEIKTENYIVYSGDAEVGITITIHAVGSATNVTIYNTGTKESMSIDTDKLETLTGYGIIKGDDITICTVKGSKSITLTRSGTTTNILNCLDKDADWFQLSKGDNVFAYTADSGSDNLQFFIENNILYEGV